jgi:hypothetical protein
MEINAIGSVLIDLFELEAVLGLVVLAVVVGVLAHALLETRHRGGLRPRVGSRR